MINYKMTVSPFSEDSGTRSRKLFSQSSHLNARACEREHQMIELFLITHAYCKSYLKHHASLTIIYFYSLYAPWWLVLKHQLLYWCSNIVIVHGIDFPPSLPKSNQTTPDQEMWELWPAAIQARDIFTLCTSQWRVANPGFLLTLSPPNLKVSFGTTFTFNFLIAFRKQII